MIEPTCSLFNFPMARLGSGYNDTCRCLGGPFCNGSTTYHPCQMIRHIQLSWYHVIFVVHLFANAYPAFRFFVLCLAMYVQCLIITELLTTDALAFTATCVLFSEVFFFLCLFLLSGTCILFCLITVRFSFICRIYGPCKQLRPRYFRMRREQNRNIHQQSSLCCLLFRL